MRVLTLWLVLALAVAGCGGDTDGDAPRNVDRLNEDTAEMFGKAETRSTGVRPNREPAEADDPGGDRGDTYADPQEEPYEFSYQIGHLNCGYDVEQVYDEAGTRDPQQAADWYGEGLREGPHQDGGIAGCLDAILGRPARH